MDFTREPIIETIITPKDGCKLVIRSSKNSGQEEYFVDAVEIVSFGNALFYRSLERPKAFLAPINDFEVVEVREARMVLKNVGHDRSIKIGGGRDVSSKNAREQEKPELNSTAKDEVASSSASEEQSTTNGEISADVSEVKVDKKRDRRRNYRKRRGKEEKEEGVKEEQESADENMAESKGENQVEVENVLPESVIVPPNGYSDLLQPPPLLISETIKKYRENELFKNAFYLSEDEQYKPHAQVDDLLNEDNQEIHYSHTENNSDENQELETLPSELVEETDTSIESNSAHILDQNERDHQDIHHDPENNVGSDSLNEISHYDEHDLESPLPFTKEEKNEDQMDFSPVIEEEIAENFEELKTIENKTETALPLYAEEERISENEEDQLESSKIDEEDSLKQ